MHRLFSVHKIVVLICFFFCSCTSLHYFGKAYVDEGDYLTDYVNDSISLRVTYSANYHIRIAPVRGEAANKILAKLSADTLATIGVFGESEFSPQYKTALFVYRAIDHFRFTESVGDNLKKTLSPEFLTFSYCDSAGLLTDAYYKDFPALRNHRLNRLSYEKKKGKRHWIFLEYHLLHDDHILRFVWWIDKNNGFGDEIDKRFQSASFQSQAEYILASIEDVSSKSEGNPFIVAAQGFLRNKNYLPPLYLLDKFKSDSFPDRLLASQYFQVKMFFQSFAGDHRGALVSADKAFGKKTSSMPEVDFRALQAKDAAEVIAQKSKHVNVLMINEAHHMPSHRAFLRDILPLLFENGYRFLALEALSYDDTLINERKFPIQESGYYTMEPVFGQLIRRACELGFTLVPYEDETDCDETLGSESNYCNNQRELNQAKNIVRFLESHPEGKMVVYGGFDHIQERNKGTWKHMAQYFKELTGIDPLTIDQTQMSERSDEKYENPYYQTITKRVGLATPAILVQGDTCWVAPENKGAFDIQIFHSRTRYIDNIPHWSLPKWNPTKEVTIRLDEGGRMRLFELFHEDEMEEDYPIPVLTRLLNIDEYKVVLRLPPGHYAWRIKDVDQSTGGEKLIEIE